MSIENRAHTTGNWGEDIRWELYESSELPPKELCTAVFCVAIAPDGRVLLMRAERGWGIIGGHIEDGETLAEALLRESMGEGGIVPANPKPFAYRAITAANPIPHQDQTRNYPFPTSYIIYHYSGIAGEIGEPTEEDSLERTLFTLEEIEQLDTPDLPIIKLGYESFLKSIQG